jgi:hypothetical protein
MRDWFSTVLQGFSAFVCMVFLSKKLPFCLGCVSDMARMVTAIHAIASLQSHLIASFGIQRFALNNGQIAAQ